MIADDIEAIEARRSGHSKERRVIVLRVVVTAVLCGLLAWRLNIMEFYDRLIALDVAWVGAAFLVVVIAIVISAWKWGMILQERGYRLSYLHLLRHYFVGLFFNNVLPTAIGGDAVRAWETTKDTGEIPEATGSVLTERLIAGVALGITAVLGLPFVDANYQVVSLVAFFLVLNLAAVALVLKPRIATTVVRALLPSRFSSAGEVVAKTVLVVEQTLRTRALFLKVFVLSIVFQLFVAGVNASIFEAMGLEVSLAACITFTPMIFTITMLPISISGLGVREAAYWFFFSQVGVGQVDAIAASLAFFVIVGGASLPGALLFIVRGAGRAQSVGRQEVGGTETCKEQRR